MTREVLSAVGEPEHISPTARYLVCVNVSGVLVRSCRPPGLWTRILTSPLWNDNPELEKAKYSIKLLLEKICEHLCICMHIVWKEVCEKLASYNHITIPQNGCQGVFWGFVLFLYTLFLTNFEAI